MKKLSLWETQLRAGELAHFPTLAAQAVPDRACYATAINKMKVEFDQRFCDFQDSKVEFQIFTSPFDFPAEEAPSELQMDLLDLQARMDLKTKFSSQTPLEFYQADLPRESFQSLAKMARKVAAMFGSTYSCEQLFSLMKHIKSRQRSSLTDSHLSGLLRISTSSFQANYSDIMNNREKFNKSH